jgi:hypothetical protein
MDASCDEKMMNRRVGPANGDVFATGESPHIAESATQDSAGGR